MDQIFIVCVLRQKSFIVCDFTDISCKFGGACADLDLRIHMTGRRFCDMSVKYYTIEQKSSLAISLTLCFFHSLFTYLYAFSFHGPEQVIGYPSHLQQKTLMPLEVEKRQILRQESSAKGKIFKIQHKYERLGRIMSLRICIQLPNFTFAPNILKLS